MQLYLITPLIAKAMTYYKKPLTLTVLIVLSMNFLLGYQHYNIGNDAQLTGDQKWWDACKGYM